MSFFKNKFNHTTTPTYTPFQNPSAFSVTPTANVNAVPGMVYGTAGATASYTATPSTTFSAGASRNFSSFNNKGSNTFTGGMRFNF